MLVFLYFLFFWETQIVLLAQGQWKWEILSLKLIIHLGLNLVSFFHDMSTFMVYLMPKPSLKKDSSGTI